MMTTTTPRPASRADYVKQIGVVYWYKLMQLGVPQDTARKIAAAIAKFDAVQRPPSPEQQALISEFSVAVCRAQLWRRQLLR